MKKLVFPDASIMLHFSPLDEIDLLQILDCTSVEVVYTLVVTEELVRQRWDHPTLDGRYRAKNSIKQMEQWLDGQREIGPNVKVSFLGNRPENDTMKINHLNWQDLNDLLLGIILDYQQAHAYDSVFLLTGDSDFAFRATSLGIQALVLPQEYSLLEAQNMALAKSQYQVQELATNYYRASSLLLTFADGQNEMVVSVMPQLSALTPTMQAQLVGVADDMRKKAGQLSADDTIQDSLNDPKMLATLVTQAFPIGGRSLSGRVSAVEVERYRKEIAAYPEKFERYLRHCLEIINEHNRTIRISLKLENAGGGSAEKTLLTLSLQPQLRWQWRTGNMTMPFPPVPPTPPIAEIQDSERSYHIAELSSLPSRHFDRKDNSKKQHVGTVPLISEAGTKLQWELGTYRHRQSQLLEPLYVQFADAKDISNFTIDWQIQEKKHSRLVQGQLKVFVETVIPNENTMGFGLDSA